MPVKFEGKSEYQRRYEASDPANPPLPDFYRRPQDDPKPVPSNDGITNEPAIQHKKVVDVEYTKTPSYTVLEPPIQRKKKPVAPHGLRQTENVKNGGEQEYVLLGSQEKFTPNIIYKSKSLSQQANGATVEPETKEVEKRENKREIPPPPRVIVDTGAPDKVKKTAQVAAVNGHVQKEPTVPKKSSPPKQQSNNTTAPPKSQKTAVLKESRGDAPIKALAKKPSPNAPLKPTQSKVEPKSSVVAKQSDNTSAKAKKLGESAPDIYALQYKAGVAPHRPKGPKRLSEYQLQFSWKKGLGASPLLDAEQVVHKSSSHLAVAKAADFAKTSEYRKQYQSWDVERGRSATRDDGKKQRAVRSKSVGVSPDRRVPAGTQRVTSEHDPRLVQESLNPLRLHFPHGPQKKESSEYAAKFMPPRDFAYEQGVWKEPKTAPADLEGKAGEDVTSSWFSEVLELRNKAEEYKRRARGTHFSRQHVAQLLAKQSELWDSASSVISALSLEPPASDRSASLVQKSRKTGTADVSSQPPAGKRTAWGQDRDPLTPRDNASVASGASIANTYDLESYVSESPVMEEVIQETEITPVSPSEDATLSADGRLPTPVIAGSKRHHLDRTTPLVGGALLTSPNVKKGKGKRRSKSAQSQGSVVTDATVDAVSPSPGPERVEAETSKSVNSLMRPTYGMPTRDSHFLLDDGASTDRPLSTKYVNGPPKGARNNREKFPEVDVPSTIEEAGGSTYKTDLDTRSREVLLSDIPPRPVVDDDVLSMSARSIASSCSLAMEVLERAKDRRDNFWGQGRTGKA